jgi:hypothetical protein
VTDYERHCAAVDAARAEGFALAKEQAARVADRHPVICDGLVPEDCSLTIAIDIRALSPSATLCVVERATVEKVKAALLRSQQALTEYRCAGHKDARRLASVSARVALDTNDTALALLEGAAKP